jgi:O-antigen ligase
MRVAARPSLAAGAKASAVLWSVGLAIVALVGAALMGFVAVTDRAEILVGATGAVVALVFVKRRPRAVIVLWALLVPVVATAPNDTFRKAFWVGHRLLPVLALGVVILGMKATGRSDDSPEPRRTGLIEWLMAGYFIATVLSVLYTRSDTLPAMYQVYDKILIPMVLFLLIVLVAPSEETVRRFLPVVGIVMLTQVLIGAVSWIAPGMLPGPWARRVGERTVGSFGTPGEYTVVLITGILLLAHVTAFPDRTTRRLRGSVAGDRRRALVLILLAFVMVAFTFSRARWAAAAIVMVGIFVLHRRVGRVALVAFIAVVLLAASTGVIESQLDFAEQRFQSEGSTESALSRLPVAVAAVRMFQERPIEGWGYGNFDRYDRDFQTEVAGYFPQNDHVSHNVYLTIIAEQGLVGIALYLGPLIGAAVLTRRSWAQLPRTGFWSRKLVVALWLALAAHVSVNNFADSQYVVGPSLWWMTIALIVTIGRRYSVQVPASRLTS